MNRGCNSSNSRNVVVVENEIYTDEAKALWVFAYGSLCWKPGFQFHKAVTGYISGYKRRFWQGNTKHRGTDEKPGRVATLIEDVQESVYGIAFKISGEDAIPYLSKRECQMGGYVSHFTTFYPKTGDEFKVLLYIAAPTNPHWLGDAHEKVIADQIVESCGPSGHNVEYLLRLANFTRKHFPGCDDKHLYQLEEEVLKILTSKQLSLSSLMGDGEGCIEFVKQESRNSSPTREQGRQERVESFEHTTRVPEKQLRCLNI